MDVLERLCQLIEEDPDITNKEMAEILISEGLISDESILMEFFDKFGIEDDE